MKIKLILVIALAIIIAIIAMVALVPMTMPHPDVFRGELRFACVYESSVTNGVAKKALSVVLPDDKAAMREYASKVVADLCASDLVRENAKHIFAEKHSRAKIPDTGTSTFDDISLQDITCSDASSCVPVFQLSATARDGQIVEDVLRSWFEAMLSENDKRRKEQHKSSMENLLGWVQKFKKDIAAMDEEIRSLKDKGAPVPLDLQSDREKASDVVSGLEHNVEILESPTNCFWQIRFLSLDVMEVK